MVPYAFQAQEFIEKTGIDALAVCIGNVHGKYPASGPNLRLELLKVRLSQSCFLAHAVLSVAEAFSPSLLQFQSLKVSDD